MTPEPIVDIALPGAPIANGMKNASANPITRAMIDTCIPTRGTVIEPFK